VRSLACSAAPWPRPSDQPLPVAVRPYVQGSAVAELAEREWRMTIAPWVRSIIEDARFPAFAQVVVAADDMSFEERFAFGLERVLDGFERYAADQAVGG
jgi:hypothetical protein